MNTLSRRLKFWLLPLGLAASAGIFPAIGYSQSLVWSDEFNSGQLDPNIWNIETGTGVNGNWGTGQLDRATDRPENINFVQGVSGADGGVLSITTRKEFYIDRDYTSGRINTAGKVAWGPGHRIEARVWPQDVRYQGQGFAFWMMPDEVPAGYDYIMWPQGGEIDIMEYVGSIPYHNLGTVHYAWFWEDNLYQDWNHGHLGGYYSYKDQQGPDEPEWITVDLGITSAITRVVLNWEAAYGEDYKIQVSNDNVNWTDIYSTTSGDGGIDDLNVSGSGRYVRMYGTFRGTDWSYSLFEFEIYSGSANLALNRPATASSVQGDDVGPALAVDGQYSTRWSSALRNPGYGGYPPAPGDVTAGSSGFHTYGIDWYQDRMEFHVDGNVYHVHYLNDGAAFPPADGNDEAHTRLVDGKRVYISEYSNHFPEWHPFEHQMYMILSAGVGGPSGFTYGGGIVPEAEFPASVYIDWVRVYQLDGSTPPPPPPAGENLALNRPAFASSIEGEALSADEAFDGDLNTRWASGWSDPQWIYVDLGDTYTIDEVVLTWEAAYATHYQIQVSDDASNWTTVYSTTEGTGGVENLPVNGSGRYVRLYGTARGTGYGYSLFEIEVHGDAGTTPPPPSGNKALNRPATASSEEGAAWNAQGAVDGDSGTRWSSQFSDPQWIYIDLGSSQAISRVLLNWEGAYGKSYEIQVSDDASNWTSIYSTTTGDGGIDDINLSGNGRYVRMVGSERGTGYGYSLWEFEVY